MAKKVPHKSKTESTGWTTSQIFFVIISILLAISMVASLFVGLF